MEPKLVLLTTEETIEGRTTPEDPGGNGEVTTFEDPNDTTALSPFLPGTNIQWAWDSTSLGYLKTCPRLYQYIMVEGWQSESESVHLRFGQELHKAIENYHISRAADIPHDDAVFDVVRALLASTEGWVVNEDTRAGKYKNRRSLVRTVIHYLDDHQDDPASTYIKENGEAAVELSFRFELDFSPRSAEGVPFTLCGHLDRVVNFQDSLYVMDYKTTTSTPSSSYFAQWEPNNQMTLYTLASKVIMDTPIKGVIIDAAQILLEPPYSRFVRGMTYRTEMQLEEWIDDLAWWFSLAETWAENNHWPMNDTACDKYGGCRFRSICSKSPQVREQFLKAEFKKGPAWNPLEVRGNK